jgi:DNA-binding PadR family transcriptional regulator
MIPLYILGILSRMGPMHGYRIKKAIGEELSDFTNIKLPTIYYHLEKMRRDGLLAAAVGRESGRPEKTVYSVAKAGTAAFMRLLDETLELKYRPTFDADAVLYFSDRLPISRLRDALRRHCGIVERELKGIKTHREKAISRIPPRFRAAASGIFSHHIHHYQAELVWAREILAAIEAKKRRTKEAV